MEWLTLLTAFIPVVSDGVRAGINKLFGVKGNEPKTVAEQIDLNNSEVGKLNALAALDQVGAPAKLWAWVVNYRALHRYVIADLIILYTCFYAYQSVKNPEQFNTQILTYFLNLSGSIFFFLFGDRVYFHLKGGK